MTASVLAAPEGLAPVELRLLRRAARPRRRVLLLHGLANSATVWTDAVRAWPQCDEVWSADLPWRATAPADWNRTGDHVAALAEALDSVDGGADTIVAHSYSAGVLLTLLTREALAGRTPADRGIRELVLVSPFFRRDPGEFSWAEMAHYPANFHRIMEAGVRLRATRRLDPELQRDMAARVCERVGPYGWAKFLEIYLGTPWLRTDLLDVACLVLAGASDDTPPPTEARSLAAALPGARLRLLDGTGHFSMVERPADFVALIDEFLSTGESV